MVWILKRMNKSKIKSFYFSAIHLLEPHMKRKVNADRHLFFCLRMQLRDVTKTNRTLAKLKGFFVCLLFMIWVWKNENITLVPSLQSNQCKWSDIHQKMTTNSDFMRQCTELFSSYAGVHEIFYYLLNPQKWLILI